jgi:hypothetical protein
MENRDPNRLLVGRMGGESSDSVASSLPSLRASSAASSSAASSSSSLSIGGGGRALTKPRPQRRPDDELSGIDWVDSVVDVASTCKKILTAHTCRLCQVYTDAQVEFEVRQEESARKQHHQQQQQQHPQQQARSAAPVASTSFFQTMMMPNPLEVEMYRQFLFDEDSVVEGVNEREKVFDEDDDDEEKAEEDAQQRAAAVAAAAAANVTWS